MESTSALFSDGLWQVKSNLRKSAIIIFFPKKTMNLNKIKHFERETLQLFRELVALGHYKRALEVLRSGQATVQLIKQMSSLYYYPALREEEEHGR